MDSTAAAVERDIAFGFEEAAELPLVQVQAAFPVAENGKFALDASDIGKSITGDPATLRFAIGDVVLKPFYETYGRHSVYLHVTLK